MHADSKVLTKLGGSTKVARLLGKGFTPQRINNWFERGIPPRVKVNYPELFMPHLIGKAKRKTHVTQS